jgi:hypothetical protein
MKQQKQCYSRKDGCIDMDQRFSYGNLVTLNLTELPTMKFFHNQTGRTINARTVGAGSRQTYEYLIKFEYGEEQWFHDRFLKKAGT